MISIISNILVFLTLMTIFTLHFSAAGDWFSIEDIDFAEILGKESIDSNISAETNITSALNFHSKEYNYEFNDLTPHDCKMVRWDEYNPEYTSGNFIEFARGELEYKYDYSSLIVNPGSRDLQRIYDNQRASYISQIEEETNNNINYGYIFGGNIQQKSGDNVINTRTDWVDLLPANTDSDLGLEVFGDNEEFITWINPSDSVDQNDTKNIRDYCEENHEWESAFQITWIQELNFTKQWNSDLECDHIWGQDNDYLNCENSWPGNSDRSYELEAEDGGEIKATFSNDWDGCDTNQWFISEIQLVYEDEEVDSESVNVTYMAMTEDDEIKLWKSWDTEIIDMADIENDFDSKMDEAIEFFEEETYSGLDDVEQIGNLASDYSRSCEMSVWPERWQIQVEFSNLYNVFN